MILGDRRRGRVDCCWFRLLLLPLIGRQAKRRAYQTLFTEFNL
jgi:hypothetical protein